MAKCIFCKRQRALTLEHVFPDWLRYLYPNGLVVTNQLTGAFQKEWPSVAFQHKARIVCESCNSGWMSQLETSTRPLLTKLFNLEQILVGKDEQRLLSYWSQKTMLMLNQAIPKNLKITQDVYDDIYDNRSFTKKVLVNMGWRMRYGQEKNEPLASYEQKQIESIDVLRTLEEDIKADISNGGFIWKAILAIGPVVFELIGHNMRAKLEVGFQTKVFQTIQPYISDMRWPLEWPIEAEGGLDAIKKRQ